LWWRGSLFKRNWRVVLAIPLIVAIWPVSLRAAGMAMVNGGRYFSPHDVLSPACVGGLIGGVGLVLCASVCCGRLLSPKYILGGAIVGSLSALSFVPWLRSDMNSYPSQLLAFAIWQGAVGTYLYTICAHAQKNNEPAEH